jgi:negative regulator of genetic competence, sporulation and motility
LRDIFHVCELIVELFLKTSDEVSENERFWSWDGKVLVQVEFAEGFLAAVCSKSAILNEVLVVNKTITIDSL